MKTSAPYAFTFPDADRWFLLYEWLRDQALDFRMRDMRCQTPLLSVTRNYPTASLGRIARYSAGANTC